MPLTDAVNDIIIAIFISFIISVTAIQGASYLMRVLRVMIQSWGVRMDHD